MKEGYFDLILTIIVLIGIFIIYFNKRKSKDNPESVIRKVNSFKLLFFTLLGLLFLIVKWGIWLYRNWSW